MKTTLALVLCFSALLLSASAQNKPLRVFIRAGEKTHGPGQHDHPRFLKEGKDLLNQRGALCDGAMTFPTAGQLEATDVLVLFCQDGGTISAEERTHLETFLKRGGGMVVLHDAVCGADPHWFKTIVGGAWEHGHSKWYEGNVGIYFLERDHPITKGVSNFEIDDEIYYDLHMMPEAKVLAGSFHSVFNIAPQIWTYEKDNYRAFVDLLGHNYTTFEAPHTRALLLRGIAWAGKRDVDLLLNEADKNSLMYPEGGPTAPDKAAEKIVLHPEFTISLVAAEPMVQKAISFDWDGKGRLWLAETPEYPNGRRINQNDRIIASWSAKDPTTFAGDKDPRAARDRIVILEDTNHDGKMDRRTVWYEGLELVTSLVLYRDGVIVSQAPDIYWLRDKDGDGKAETKETVYTGFGNLDTHAVISNLRWGMDGWIYATVGYSRGDIKSGDGRKSFGKITEGVIRFKPDGSALEQVSSKGSNTWGMDFDWDNEIFFTQATSGDHLNHVVLPESVLARGKVGSTASYKPIHDHTKAFPLVKWTKQPYVQIDVVGGFTAAAGSCIYTGGAWPSKFNGTHFLSEPTINLVHQDFIRPAGTTFLAYKEREQEFVTSRDLWFRPIHTRVGPDGALYILDFYNQAVVHNDTRGPRHGAGNAAVRPDRDHYFGRIWRVQHKEAKNFEIPALDTATPDELVKALEHPNGWVRMRAQRLMAEMPGVNAILAQNLNKLARDENAPAPARVHALWALENRNGVDRQTLIKCLNDAQPALRKNALHALAETFPSSGSAATPPEVQELTQIAISRLKDTDPRARLQAIVALGTFSPDKEIAQSLVAIYPDLTDPWSQSAVVGVGAKAPLLFLDAALSSNPPDGVAGLVAALSAQLGDKQDRDQAAQLVIALASKPASADGLKQTALENFVRGLKPEVVPAWSVDLKEAFKKFIASQQAGLPGAALPLVARWDKDNSMAADVATLLEQLRRQLQDSNQTDETRAAIAANLLGVHNLNREIVPSVARLLASGNSSALQRRVIEALGATPDAAVGQQLAAAYPGLPPELQEVAFGQIVKRADWTLALVQAIQERKISLASLGTSSIHRLRTHNDKAAAQRANAVIDEIRGPEMKEKNELIAKFTPVVERPGSLENGHKTFTVNCANCHKFKGEGRDVAPDLTGMGAHGPADLLVHILDPNRFVEANYVAVSIETKDNEVIDGIVARENRNSVVLRNASGDVEIRADNIQSRRSTGLSLMPSGFEALGGEALRDLLSYICADESRYRLLDLTPAFTANSTKGIYAAAENSNETLQFKKFGVIKVGDIPFQVASPSKSLTGNNVCVLRGGSGFAKSLPGKVEVKAGVKATQLHFLGGVGGWAYPWGDKSGHDVPVMKVTVHYADSQTEEIIVKNGQEVADYNGSYDVPGSKAVPDLVKNGQVRWFSKPLKRQEMIDHISLESFDNHVAPTIVAITAELAGTGQHLGQPEPVVFLNKSVAIAATGTGPSAASQTATPSTPNRNMFLALIVGGGSSHDFDRWFNREDSLMLQATEKAAVAYTDKPESVLQLLRNLDVLYLSNNQPLTNSGLREGIFQFVDAGKGLLLVHPALWYNWKDWPEYNRVLVGGGARSHDKYGEFEVTVTEPSHPILAGVPKTFKITDELYRFEKDPEGSPIQVLATGTEPSSGKTYPILWIVQHPKGRIVCNTLGHDGQAHQHPAYKTILQNSLLWVARKSDK